MSKAELAKAMEAEDDRTEVTKLANSKGYEISSNKIINFCAVASAIELVFITRFKCSFSFGV